MVSVLGCVLVVRGSYFLFRYSDADGSHISPREMPMKV